MTRPPHPPRRPAATSGHPEEPVKDPVMKLHACLTPREQRRLAAVIEEHQPARKPGRKKT